MLQYLPYFWNMKIHMATFVFHFMQLKFFNLMNAFSTEGIDQKINLVTKNCIMIKYKENMPLFVFQKYGKF